MSQQIDGDSVEADVMERYILWHDRSKPRNPDLSDSLFNNDGNMVDPPDYEYWFWDHTKSDDENIIAIDARNMNCRPLHIRIADQYEAAGAIDRFEADTLRRDGFNCEPSMNQGVIAAETLINDPEFEALIPPLTEAEHQQLSESIISMGCLDAVKIWKGKGIIVDGHNRLEICAKNRIDFTVQLLEFESREDVKLWIVQHQLGRRNINAYQRTWLALSLKPILEDRAKVRQRGGQGGALLLQNSAEATPIDTRAELAKLANVSTDTVAKVVTIQNLASPEQLRQLETGEQSIHAIHKAISKGTAKEKRSAAALFEYETLTYRPQEYDLEISVRLNPLQADALDVDLVLAGLKSKLVEWRRMK